jgi:Tfp pilus assembly protein PilW
MVHRSGGVGNERGTTLVELVVALGLLGMIIAGILAAWGASGRVYQVASVGADLQQEVRVAFDRMIREIRLARANPCQEIAPSGQTLGVQAAAATAITVSYFSPGTTDCTATVPTFTRARYAYNSGARRLERDDLVGSGLQPLTGAVINAVNFQYRNCNGSATTTLVDIARVVVQVDAQVTVGGEGAVAKRLVADVHVRNKSCANVGL